MSAAIVKLPSAAPRQVRQPQNRDARAAKQALRDQQPCAFPHRFPSQREAERIAEAIHPMTPERWLLLGILHALDADSFAKVVMTAAGNQTAAGLLRMAKGGVGINMDVMNALERLGQ